LVGNAVPAVPPLTQAWGPDTRGATWLHGCVPNTPPHRRGDNPLIGWVEGALKWSATHNKHLDDKKRKQLKERAGATWLRLTTTTACLQPTTTPTN
jgi:hypothetical protein